ncbi:MAG: hypothetical protein LBN06_01640 [Prevotellaceae bacterium]|jgi:hypothetical protein|nr:hypothetical protein [Prevotellaceae bacterium]
MKKHIYRMMRYTALMMMGALLVTACGDDDDNQPVVVETFNVTNVTYNSVVFNGEVLQGSPSERGVCWSTSDHPTVSDNHRAAGSGFGQYQVAIDGLSEGTTYYIRAYAVSGGETLYGTTVDFRTYDYGTPAIEVVSIASTDLTAINCNVMVVTTGGKQVQTRGICWSTSPNPTSDLSTKVENSEPQASFVGAMTGLEPETTYYIRPYLVYEGGLIYGEETHATTAKVIRNNKVSDFAVTDGGFTGVLFTNFNPAAVKVLEQGYVYSLKAFPAMEDADAVVVKLDDIEPGTYNIKIDADLPKLPYHIRSYVLTQDYGLYYSEDATYSMPASFDYYLGDYELKYSSSTSTTNPNRTLPVSLVKGEKENTYYLEGINEDESIKIVMTYNPEDSNLYLYGQNMAITPEGYDFWWMTYALDLPSNGYYTYRSDMLYAIRSEEFGLVDGQLHFSLNDYGSISTTRVMVGFTSRTYNGSTRVAYVPGKGGYYNYYYLQMTKK